MPSSYANSLLIQTDYLYSTYDRRAVLSCCITIICLPERSAYSIQYRCQEDCMISPVSLLVCMIGQVSPIFIDSSPTCMRTADDHLTTTTHPVTIVSISISLRLTKCVVVQQDTAQSVSSADNCSTQDVGYIPSTITVDSFGNGCKPASHNHCTETNTAGACRNTSRTDPLHGDSSTCHVGSRDRP